MHLAAVVDLIYFVGYVNRADSVLLADDYMTAFLYVCG